MSLKAELKKEIRNVKNDMAKEIDKQWDIPYGEHIITIKNTMLKEQLFVDGELLDEHSRKSIWGHLIPFIKLKGVFLDRVGQAHKIHVKIGGYMKFNLFVKVDGQEIYTETTKLKMIPWANKQPIAAFLMAQVNETGTITDFSLPDEEFYYGEGEERFEPGYHDQYVMDVTGPFFVKKALKLWKAQLAAPTEENRKATYDHLLFEKIAIYGNELIDVIVDADLDEAAVQREALWLIEHATHREVIKFAISMLATTNCEAHYEKLYQLGLHDEFTPYVVFALTNGPVQVNDLHLRLAQNVHGWGRVVAVNALDAHSPTIKNWLLTDACTGSQFDRYIALTCANQSEIDVVLLEDQITKEQFKGAAYMISGLLQQEPNEGIDDYTYTSRVLTRFVHHARIHCTSFDDLYPVALIGRYAAAHENVWVSRFEEQWTYREREQLEQLLQPFRQHELWQTKALATLASALNEKTLVVATFLQLDVSELLFEKLQQDPANTLYIQTLLEMKDEQVMTELCTFATKHYDINAVQTEAAYCLSDIVSALTNYEDIGTDLVAAMIASTNQSHQIDGLIVADKQWHEAYRQPTEALIKRTKNKHLRTEAQVILTRNS